LAGSRDFSGEKTLSLKEMRKRATDGPRATCPACGKNVALLEITSGRHVANDCAPFKQSALDANNPRLQERLKKDHDQSKLVMKRQTWSERHFEMLGESNFIRQYWAPSMLALALLSWLVGYTTPQGSGSTYFITFLAGPIMVMTMIVLGFKGKWEWLHNPFRKK
jgi:hypothetical protein